MRPSYVNILIATGAYLLIARSVPQHCAAQVMTGPGSPSRIDAKAGFAVYQTPAASQQETTLEWRHTGEGWQRIPIENPPAIHLLSLPHRLPVVHPIRFAILVLLSVLMALAWSSDEWQWGRLVKENSQ